MADDSNVADLGGLGHGQADLLRSTSRQA
jgi:hypothetical protein